LRLGVIISPLPYNIQDGQLVDAVPVMGDFNHIVSQVNANAQTIITGLGTFTPIVAFGGGSTGVTYAFRVGNYIRVGNMIFFALDALLSNKGSDTGTLTIAGLPIVCSAAWCPGGVKAGAVGVSNVTFAGKYLVANVVPSTDQMDVFNVPSAGVFTVLTDTNVANNSEFYATGFYPV